MPFESHIREWEEMSHDPLWAVLTGKRDWQHEEFFATGKADVDELLVVAHKLGFPHDRIRALDFGCGVGRTTRHLSKHFPECLGVDISREMLRLAKEYNPSCHFHLCEADDLGDFPDSHFDLVYSVLVLQHQPSRRVIEKYIHEFIRILRPNGLLAFHLPSRIPFRYRLAPRRRAYRLLHAVGVKPERLRNWNLFPMKMTAISRERVEEIITNSRARVLLAEPHKGSNPIPSLMYYCTK